MDDTTWACIGVGMVLGLIIGCVQGYAEGRPRRDRFQDAYRKHQAWRRSIGCKDADSA